MAKEDVAATVLAALEARAATHGVDVVLVELVGASKAPCVRVRIDHADESLPTITLDEVAEQTTWISEVLDELDPLPDSYTLEVSSPGLDRPLRRPHDFERFAGEQVQLATTATEGRRKFTGTLLGLDDERAHVLLYVQGERVELPLELIKKCTIKPDFSAAMRAAEKGAPDQGEK